MGKVKMKQKEKKRIRKRVVLNRRLRRKSYRQRILRR
jgi:hypothetical protein